MKMFMKVTLLICSIFALLIGSNAYADEGKREAQLLRERLRQRKASWDAHLAAEMSYHQKRKAAANRHKKVRSQHIYKKAKARRSYTRTNQIFPIKEYRQFIAYRDRRVAKKLRQRRDFQKLRDQLEAVIKTNKFKINKMQEYNL